MNESPVAIGYDTISDFNPLEGVIAPGLVDTFEPVEILLFELYGSQAAGVTMAAP